jgi:hypothetical protein
MSWLALLVLPRQRPGNASKEATNATQYLPRAGNHFSERVSEDSSSRNSLLDFGGIFNVCLRWWVVVQHRLAKWYWMLLSLNEVNINQLEFDYAVLISFWDSTALSAHSICAETFCYAATGSDCQLVETNESADESANMALPSPYFQPVFTSLERNLEFLINTTIPRWRFSVLDLQVLENPHKKHSNCPL